MTMNRCLVMAEGVAVLVLETVDPGSARTV